MTTEEPDQAAQQAEHDRLSLAELAAGRLPLNAQERLAALRRTGGEDFTSDLSIAEHHAVRSVGFDPVGQVMGSCVYQIGYTGSWQCGLGYGAGGIGMGRMPGLRLPPGFGGPLGGGWGGAVVTQEVVPLRQALIDARGRALHRLRLEAAALGADGVVAVRFAQSSFPSGYNAVEYVVIGTAVRATGAVHPARPFLSDLSGQEFAKLLLAGWVPVDFVTGLSVQIRHDDWSTAMQRGSWSNTEVSGYTGLVTEARTRARDRLYAAARHAGAVGVVVADMTLQIREKRCAASEGEDHVVEAVVTGTAIAPTGGRTAAAPPHPLTMIRLTDRTGASR